MMFLEYDANDQLTAHPGVASLGLLAVSWTVVLLLAGALSGPCSVASFTGLGAGGPVRPGGPGSCSFGFSSSHQFHLP